MKPSTHLELARALIEPPGRWLQGSYRSRHRPLKRCVIGALSDTSDCGPSFYEAQRYLDAAMDNNAIRTNDLKDTQHIHVLMAYDFAVLMAQDDEARK